MEGLIKDQLIDHLTNQKLIKGTQFGFMKRRSCPLNLLTYLEIITTLIDNGKPVDIIYLDYSKAFDRVPHQRLKLVLEAHGITGQTLGWIMNWLKGRTQFVKINGCKSNRQDVLSGVPQGSILGPILFIIYINSMDGAVEEFINIISKFADDSKVGTEVSTAEQRQNLQHALNNLSDWSDTWNMLFNEKKCKVMHFGRNNIQQSYSINNVTLEKSNAEKDVGILVSDDLKPSEQCLKAACTGNRAVLYRDENTWTKLYCTYVRPHLEYAVTAWSPWYEKDCQILEKVQVRALSQITSLNHLNYEEKLKKLSLLSLKERRERLDMCQVWRILHNYDDVQENTWFTRANITSNRSNRQNASAYNLSEQYASKDIKRNFFSVRVIRPWNNLPEHVKSAKTISAFKRNYDEFIKSTS